jgi:hypothetical protein
MFESGCSLGLGMAHTELIVPEMHDTDVIWPAPGFVDTWLGYIGLPLEVHSGLHPVSWTPR